MEPATNVAGSMLIKKELGNKVTLIYLAGISIVSVVMGLILDWLVNCYKFQINISIEQQNSFLPYSVNVFAGVILLLVAVPKIRNKLMPFFLATEEEIKNTDI